MLTFIFIYIFQVLFNFVDKHALTHQDKHALGQRPGSSSCVSTKADSLQMGY
jgi:hypothetical protein